MSFWDRFRKGTVPPPSSPPAAAPTLPALPADGAIESYDLADAVGTLRLSDGSALRFGKTACAGFEPAAGLSVRVLEAVVGPGKRVRAKQIELRSSVGEYDELVQARDRAAGLTIHDDRRDKQAAVIGVIKLGVTTDAPITDHAALRALWTAADLDTFAPLELSPSAVARCGNQSHQLFFGGGPLEPHLDMRYAHAARPGHGFVGIYEGVYAPTYEMGTPGSLWGFGPHGNARAVASIVARLARASSVTGVIVGSADQLWLPADEWLRRADGHDDPARIRVEAFVDVAYGPPDATGARHMRTYGMHRGLGLPDIEVLDAHAMNDEQRHYFVQSIAWMAARVLAGEDAFNKSLPAATFPLGETVTVGVEEGRATFRVVELDESEPLFRLADAKLLDS